MKLRFHKFIRYRPIFKKITFYSRNKMNPSNTWQTFMIWLKLKFFKKFDFFQKFFFNFQILFSIFCDFTTNKLMKLENLDQVSCLFYLYSCHVSVLGSPQDKAKALCTSRQRHSPRHSLRRGHVGSLYGHFPWLGRGIGEESAVGSAYSAAFDRDGVAPPTGRVDAHTVISRWLLLHALLLLLSGHAIVRWEMDHGRSACTVIAAWA